MTYDSTLPYPRDLSGYGREVPHARWPEGAVEDSAFIIPTMK